jgi:pimeloyl-ACP methyl ester carboxylesterase
MMKSNKDINLNIHFDKGTGKLVVLVHGVEDSGKFWVPIDTEISKTNRCVSVDLLGFGDSPGSPSGLYTLEENVEALESTIKSLDFSGKITLVGHSMGTFPVLEYARQNPSRIEKIVLTSPVFIFKEGPLRYKRYWESLQHSILSKTDIMRSVYLHRNGTKFIPSVLSVDSMVGKQRPLELFDALKNIDVTIMYGYLDSLVINSNIRFLDNRYSNVKAQGFNRFHDIPHTESKYLLESLY